MVILNMLIQEENWFEEEIRGDVLERIFSCEMLQPLFLEVLLGLRRKNDARSCDGDVSKVYEFKNCWKS